VERCRRLGRLGFELTRPAKILACAAAACGALGLGFGATLPAMAQTAASVWKFDRKSDPITGGVSAWVLASRVTALTGHLPRPAALELLCFKNQPVIRIKYSQQIGSKRSASPRYRFDDKPGREPSVRFLPDRKSVVIEDKADVAKFIGELGGATELIVSINSLSGGATNAAFPVGGAPPPIAIAFAQCPLAATKPKAGASR
jgi:hypothetical protein